LRFAQRKDTPRRAAPRRAAPRRAARIELYGLIQPAYSSVRSPGKCKGTKETTRWVLGRMLIGRARQGFPLHKPGPGLPGFGVKQRDATDRRAQISLARLFIRRNDAPFATF